MTSVGRKSKKEDTHTHTHTHEASLVAQTVKNSLAMQETWVRSLGWEDALEKRMAAHSSILGLENSTDRGPWQATVHGATKSQTKLSN